MFPHCLYAYANMMGRTITTTLYTSYWISRGFFSFFFNSVSSLVYVISEGVRCEVNKKKKKNRVYVQSELLHGIIMAGGGGNVFREQNEEQKKMCINEG